MDFVINDLLSFVMHSLPPPSLFADQHELTVRLPDRRPLPLVLSAWREMSCSPKLLTSDGPTA